MPQGTAQRRLQLTDALSVVRGRHALKFGTELSRTEGDFFLGVFREGRVELVQDFPEFDLDRNGRVDDNDLLFAVTLRSGKPDQDLCSRTARARHLAFFVQDDWRVTPRLTLNLGLRYELDTDVKNVSGYGDINPIVRPFLPGDRGRDLDNFGPRIGFAWTNPAGSLQVHGGYGIYYDRVTLELISLERGLDGRALPVEVRAGNVFFLDPETGALPPGAPTFANPFTGFILPGAGASGINILDNRLENPTVQQWNLGTQAALPGRTTLKLDLVHNLGTHFIIGRPVGEVFNPVVGGPDRVVNIESSVNTKYDAVLATLERRLSEGQQLRLSYTLSRARNYANDDQIPFGAGPVDPNDLSKEYGPTPNEQRHRLVLSGSFLLPGGLRLSPLWTIASGVPMDILMPDASSRVPTLPRNAGGRDFQTGADLNAFISAQNAAGGIDGVPLPLVSDDARFSDSFNSLDLRLSRAFTLSGRATPDRDRGVLQPVRRDERAGRLEVQLLGLRERAGARQRRAGGPGLPALVVVRTAADHRGRRLRLGRSARGAARSAVRVLVADAARPELRGRLGLLPATAMVVGSTIGVGIFLTPAGMAKSLGSPGLLLAVWLFQAVLALSGAFCFGDLAARFPQAGGGYVYLREAFGPRVAFLYGWKCLLVLDPGLTAALAAGAGAYAAALWPGVPPKAVALAAIAAVVVANLAGVRLATGLAWMLAVGKAGVLLLLVAVGFFGSAGDWSRFVPFLAREAGSPPLLPALAGAVVSGVLLVRRLVAGEQPGRRGRGRAAQPAARAGARGPDGDRALRRGQRGVRLPGPARGRDVRRDVRRAGGHRPLRQRGRRHAVRDRAAVRPRLASSRS